MSIGQTMLLAVFLSVLYLCSTASAGLNKVLTDLTFEHDTQAATGQTTGIWLVRFCDQKSMSNWCVDGFIEYWADLCDELLEEHGIMTGTVDLAKNAKLATRFSSPILDKYGVQLALFKDHGMYLASVEHEGDTDMTREEVKRWVLEGHAGEARLAVPPEPSLLESVWLKVEEAEEALQKVFERVTESVAGDAEVRRTAIIVLAVVVVAFVALRGLLSSSSSSKATSKAKSSKAA